MIIKKYQIEVFSLFEKPRNSRNSPPKHPDLRLTNLIRGPKLVVLYKTSFSALQNARMPECQNARMPDSQIARYPDTNHFII